MKVRQLPSLIVVAALVSCGDATEPAREPPRLGAYRLERADGSSLPASIQVTPSCTIQADSGYLWLRDSSLFQLKYSGIATCLPADPSNGLRWEAFYPGLMNRFPDSIAFRVGLDHLGLDTLRFVGHSRTGSRVVAVVPQIPDASGPPVELQFIYDASTPVPAQFPPGLPTTGPGRN